MRWLLVSGFDNPGDEWARIGLIDLIRAADPDAKFTEIDKLNEEVLTPIPCDRVVFCGQPLVWAHKNSTTLDIAWWEPINTWMADDAKLILAGFGVFLQYDKDGAPTIKRRDEVVRGLCGLFLKARACYCRSNIIRQVVDWDEFPVHLCPSVFAGRYMERRRDRKLCNFMPGGTHYPNLDPERATQWESKEQGAMKIMREEGFYLMAHSKVECDMAHDKFNWPEDRVIPYTGDPLSMLAEYSRGSKYFGNRVHGAIVSRSFGADVRLCASDTRLEDVKYAGGDACLPEQLDLDELREWAAAEPEYNPLDLGAEFEVQKAIYEL
jgi:hypothetical protein